MSQAQPFCFDQPQVRKLAVIGLGLIGGSLAKALRASRFARIVVGYDHRPGDAEKGCELGIIDQAADSLRTAVEAADLIVLAVPVRAVETVLREVRSLAPADAVITDVGSVKGAFVDAVRAVYGVVPPVVVPGHPIAGSEKSGVTAANDQLFRKHKVILTPLPTTDAKANALVTRMWQSTGAEVIQMDAGRHDEVLASTSHLPHLIAFSLVHTLAGEDDNLEIFRYAAGGFRDFTRIAASDPLMWHDIFLSNQDATLRALDRFMHDLLKLREAIGRGDGEMLLGVFTRAKAAREHFNKMLEGKSYISIMNTRNVSYRLQPGGSVQGRIRVPGDKSISHRSIMLGSLAEGVTQVEGFLEGEDSLATLQAFRDMGIVIEGPDQGNVRIHGKGLRGLKAAPGALYLGNSGTSMRLLAGLLAGQPFDSVLMGDESLSTRPMERVAKPLRTMGAKIETGEGGRPPMTIFGGQPLKGMHYDMPMASAQVKSSLLLAGLYAEGETTVTEPAPTRDHTERMLRGFGYDVSVDGNRISLRGNGRLTGTRIDVPADISSAAFFMVAAAITPDADITLEHVGVNPTRTGIINILRLMGANIELANEHEVGGEPVADIRIRYAPLRGIHIPEDQVPLAIDEFPALFIAAVCAEGTTVLSGAEELRVKESDRIQVMADGLAALGVETEVRPDGIVIQGATIGGGEIFSHGDHRIAMSFAVASLRATGEIMVRDCANVATSFPNFVELAQKVGIRLSVEGKTSVEGS